MTFFLSLPFVLLGLALAGAVLTAIILNLVRRAAIIDVPNERSSHTTPTPRGGGITMVAMLTLAAGGWLVTSGGTGGGASIFAWSVGGVFLAAFSFIDDLRPVSALIRLPLQAFVALAVLFTVSGWPALALPGLTAVEWGGLGAVLLFFWILGLTNVYNFMDGIDGIAGVQAVAAGMGWAFVGWWLGDPFLMLVGLVLAGATLGFLWFNWSPAKLFMGDVGSAYLGFTFAVLPLIAHVRNPETALTTLLGVAVILVWPFLFDGGYTILHRIYRRENLLKAHRGHLYQRLVIAGAGHAPVSTAYGLLAVVGWPFAWMWMAGTPMAFFLTVGGLLVCAALLAFVTKHRERLMRRARHDQAGL